MGNKAGAGRDETERRIETRVGEEGAVVLAGLLLRYCREEEKSIVWGRSEDKERDNRGANQRQQKHRQTQTTEREGAMGLVTEGRESAKEK